MASQTKAMGRGLNRTSVGLKRNCGSGTQRANPRLNRTSVGLKLANRDSSHYADAEASIEPAWD